MNSTGISYDNLFYRPEDGEAYRLQVYSATPIQPEKLDRLYRYQCEYYDRSELNERDIFDIYYGQIDYGLYEPLRPPSPEKTPTLQHIQEVLEQQTVDVQSMDSKYFALHEDLEIILSQSQILRFRIPGTSSSSLISAAPNGFDVGASYEFEVCYSTSSGPTLDNTLNRRVPIQSLRLCGVLVFKKLQEGLQCYLSVEEKIQICRKLTRA
ncbi:hypothetical protein N7447_000553 [Penicillium robsamsonii]|uniref:uncharacterized protein n=1 Tax=Penicillium robsamsonii TaxID=1792511 RepID=UPI0025481F56|nr:uncharacterized protein N7447_000553 [Penicillium robsamsonii]KAJ5834527.1 hypothetical protein N7447_000553 [Penicillium robsamsonii]